MSSLTPSAFTPVTPFPTDTDAPDAADDSDGASPALTADDTPHGSSSPDAASVWTAHDWAEVTSAPAFALGIADASLPASFTISDAVADAPAPASAAGPAGGAVPSPFIVAQTNGTDPVSDIADQVVNGPLARSTYGVDGTGIKIGIISDGFNTDGGAATDEADGALPTAANVHILQDATSGPNEGRAMAQLVHTIAPGAQIYFYTCGEFDQDMATAITSLQQAGCQIIVDDVTFFDEPFYELGGTISAAVDQAVANGSTYFTAAGNAAESFYEGIFNPVTVGTTGGGTTLAHAFNDPNAPLNWLDAITVPMGLSVSVDLQWNQPFKTGLGAANGPGSANSLDFEIFSSSLAYVANGGIDDVGGDPVQIGSFTNNSHSTTTLYLAVFMNDAAGPVPGEFKIILDNDSFSPVTLDGGGIGSGTVIGHEADPNAIAVGAVPENNPTTTEVFSSVGPGTDLFDANGNLLATPLNDGKVNLLGPDGNATTVPGFGSFYGTSAAAPTAAAVGALVLDENPLLNPSDIANILADTATPVAGAAVLTGAGLVNADLAVGAAATLTFTETANVATLLGTHLNDTFIGGPGNHTISGDGGIDTLDYSAAPAKVTINFTSGKATANGYGGTDTFTGIEIAKGSAFADTFVAGTAGETLYGEGGINSLNFTGLGGAGVLTLGGGSFTSGSGTNSGTISVGASTSLKVNTAFVNKGSLVCDGGSLIVTGAITGTGSAALVENGGYLEFDGADSQGATFGGAASTLALAAPAQFGGLIGGLALGDELDFISLGVTSGFVQSSILTITLSAGGTLTFNVAGNIGGDIFAVTGDGSNGTLLTLEQASFGLASATIDGPTTINLGNARSGGTLATSLGITNSGLAPAESLDASIGGMTGDATASGTISLLADGATDSHDITVGLGTGTAGAVGGTVTLAFASDGAGTDGNGITPLPSQTVTLSGGVYRTAAPVIGGLPNNWIVHVHDTVSQTLNVSNGDIADGFSENLIASVTGTSGGVTAQGATGDIAAGASSNAITIGFSTATAGSVTGSVTLGLTTDGTGIDGLGTAALSDGIVNVSATVNNFATAIIEDLSGGGTFTKNSNNYTLALGTVGRGTAPIVIGLGVENGAVGPADLLSGSFSSSISSGFAVPTLNPFSGVAAQLDRRPALHHLQHQHRRQLHRDHHAELDRLEFERLCRRARGREAHHHRHGRGIDELDRAERRQPVGQLQHRRGLEPRHRSDIDGDGGHQRRGQLHRHQHAEQLDRRPHPEQRIGDARRHRRHVRRARHLDQRRHDLGRRRRGLPVRGHADQHRHDRAQFDRRRDGARGLRHDDPEGRGTRHAREFRRQRDHQQRRRGEAHQPDDDRRLGQHRRQLPLDHQLDGRRHRRDRRGRGADARRQLDREQPGADRGDRQRRARHRRRRHANSRRHDRGIGRQCAARRRDAHRRHAAKLGRRRDRDGERRQHAQRPDQRRLGRGDGRHHARPQGHDHQQRHDRAQHERPARDRHGHHAQGRRQRGAGRRGRQRDRQQRRRR